MLSVAACARNTALFRPRVLCLLPDACRLENNITFYLGYQAMVPVNLLHDGNSVSAVWQASASSSGSGSNSRRSSDATGQDVQLQRGLLEQPMRRPLTRYPDFQLVANEAQWEEGQCDALAPGACTSSSRASSSHAGSSRLVSLVDGEVKPGPVFAKAFGFNNMAACQAAVDGSQVGLFDLEAAYASGNPVAESMVRQGFGYAVTSGARFVVWFSGSVTIIGERIKADHLEVRFSVLLCFVHSQNASLH